MPAAKLAWPKLEVSMAPTLGFVLLINPRNPIAQTARLVRTLNRMFGAPPIACHHDFGQNPEFISDCPPNVHVVQPHVATHWGDFSCMEGMLKALGLLYNGSSAPSPDWFVFLSGSDYPIKPAAQILADLQSGGYDGYIEHKLVSDGDLVYPRDPLYPRGWKWETWLKQCHKRYCSLRLDVPSLNRYLRYRTRTYWLEHPFFTRSRVPFTPQFKCYAGEVWFAANRRCARRLLDFYATDTAVTAHYRKTLVPEESYPHTVLANDPALKLSQNFYRYVDWTRGGSNPKILTFAELPHLQDTPAHFARKFDDHVDGAVLDQLDSILFGQWPTTRPIKCA
jgi:hypothetical protein